MKRTVKSLLTVLSVTALTILASCNKEDKSVSSQFVATMESYTLDQDKTALSGTSLNWESGDLITIYGVGGHGVYSATPGTPSTTAIFSQMSGNPVTAPCRAYYPATLTSDGITITLPSTQVSDDGNLVGLPMYAESNDNTLEFKNLCGALKLHLTKSNTTVSSIIITTDANISGNYSMDYNNGEPTLTYVSNGANHVTLTCGTPQSIADGHDFYVALPAGTYNHLVIEICTPDGTHCVKTANIDIPVTRSQYTLITFGEYDLTFHRPIGSKGGLFTINDDDDQVWFSQGNLQHQASTNTWRFAEHQYDYVGTQTADAVGYYGGNVSGSDNRNISPTYSGWIDLFGWGTSGWNSGAICYLPWSTSESYSDYYPGGSYTNGLTGEYAEADWAWHNAISNGGNATHQWRTLSQSEWRYLLDTRTDAESKRGTGNINGVGGLIILPDSWTLPSECTFTSGVASSDNDWTRNSYTLAQWTQMEAAGAVFLPAAGYRVGTNVLTVGNSGYYWSSTPHNEYTAYSMFFDSYYIYAAGIVNYVRNVGFSVRPVQDKMLNY